LAVAASVWWLGGWHDARHWPIRWLEVSGELERLTAAQVRAAVAEQARRGFFAVDVDEARAAIEALPWVEQAAVSRHWPDALQISVLEQSAVARWKEHALVGRNGELFEVAGTSGMQGLTRLDGPEGLHLEVFQRWQQMRPRLAAEGLEIRRVALDPRGAWRLELSSGLELLLGRIEVAQRLERFLSVRSDLRGMASIASIDLRYPNGLALTRRIPEIRQLTGPGDAQNNQAGAQPNHG
ncbi:MAG: cell division protein FtsQ/DivIB, partial [Wenzhouxiangellaceae bacterium]